MDISSTDAGPGPAPAAAAPPDRLWAPGRRATTAAALTLVSLLAFEAMAVAAAMPAIAAALQGVQAYAWAFGALTAASIAGMLGAGPWCDRRGPLGATRLGLAVFFAGLLIAGLADHMALLVLGRAVQGLGSGLLGVALYVGMGRLVPSALHPRLFAAFAAAWVLPALLGPGVAAMLVAQLGWRSVFLPVALALPLVALALLPAFARLGRPAEVAARPSSPAWMLARRVLVAAPGLPAVVALRGLLAAAFATAEAFIPLYLHREAGWTLAQAGLVLSTGALLWSSGSAWQARLQAEAARRRALRLAMAVLAAGLALVLLPVAGMAAAAVVPLGWALAGLGIGIAYPMLSALTLQLSPPQAQGRSASALQLADALGTSLALAAAGALFGAAGAAGRLAHSLPFVLAGLLAVAGLWLAPRVDGRPRDTEPSSGTAIEADTGCQES